jgi:hypothetical protein
LEPIDILEAPVQPFKVLVTVTVYSPAETIVAVLVPEIGAAPILQVYDTLLDDVAVSMVLVEEQVS